MRESNSEGLGLVSTCKTEEEEEEAMFESNGKAAVLGIFILTLHRESDVFLER